jgi:hypothetical protein
VAAVENDLEQEYRLLNFVKQEVAVQAEQLHLAAVVLENS